MALKEQDIVFTTQDESGNTIIQMPITRAGNIEDVMSIAQGGTGASTTDDALENLGISGAIVGLSVSGKVITYTKKDGTTGTITTQDTNNSNWTISKGTNGYARDKTTGFTIQWGRLYYSSTGVSSGTITFPKTFTNTYSCILQQCSDHARSFAINSIKTTGFGYYLSAGDDLHWLAVGYCSS